MFFDLAGNFLSMPDISGRVKKEGMFASTRNAILSFTRSQDGLAGSAKKL
jgi:hypothetical protein